ncbi:hypothetical protein [Chitinophaga sp. sic0106]|uniref:hypothetical protein n=1 Tax=Chitinophaga sp. sic0106 TaxID=2854785 RepID=UPI001C44EB7B|nr:hypothetical protein [Chitinophaga sp. sic0106]MBV7531316.1 hypothetical protein [Chitinophaga sp. sic0106]
MERADDSGTVKVQAERDAYDKVAGKMIKEAVEVEISTSVIVNAMEDDHNKLQPGDTIYLQTATPYRVESIIDRFPSRVPDRLPFTSNICRFSAVVA